MFYSVLFCDEKKDKQSADQTQWKIKPYSHARTYTHTHTCTHTQTHFSSADERLTGRSEILMSVSYIVHLTESECETTDRGFSAFEG